MPGHLICRKTFLFLLVLALISRSIKFIFVIKPLDYLKKNRKKKSINALKKKESISALKIDFFFITFMSVVS